MSETWAHELASSDQWGQAVTGIARQREDREDRLRQYLSCIDADMNADHSKIWSDVSRLLMPSIVLYYLQFCYTKAKPEPSERHNRHHSNHRPINGRVLVEPVLCQSSATALYRCWGQVFITGIIKISSDALMALRANCLSRCRRSCLCFQGPNTASSDAYILWEEALSNE